MGPEPDLIEGLVPHISNGCMVQATSNHISVGQDVQQVLEFSALELVGIFEQVLLVGTLCEPSAKYAIDSRQLTPGSYVRTGHRLEGFLSLLEHDDFLLLFLWWLGANQEGADVDAGNEVSAHRLCKFDHGIELGQALVGDGKVDAELETVLLLELRHGSRSSGHFCPRTLDPTHFVVGGLQSIDGDSQLESWPRNLVECLYGAIGEHAVGG